MSVLENKAMEMRDNLISLFDPYVCMEWLEEVDDS